MRTTAASFLFVALSLGGGALQAQSGLPHARVSGGGEGDVQALAKGPTGITPLAYYNLARAAERSFEASDWAQAARLYEETTTAYPWNGEHWRRLGIARSRTREFRRAARAFARADEVGILPYPQHNAVNAARSYARAGEPDSALAWVERALYHYRLENLPTLAGDTAFGALRQHPRFHELVRAAPEPAPGRDEGWRYDLEHLLAEIRRMNAVFSRQPLPDTLARAADRLRQRIPRLTDAQIAVEMQHILVLLGHNHNTLYFPYAPGVSGRVAFTQLPLQLYAFPDGMYVTDAAPPYEELIGARVLRFDDTPAEQALRATGYVKDRENGVEILGSGPAFLVIPQVLHALGLTRNADRAELTVVDRSGRTRTVAPVPIPQQPGKKLEAPRIPGVAAPPLYLRNPRDEFWFEPLPADGALYLQFNQVANKRGESLAQFGIRFRKVLAERGVRNLVVDVRRNNGGNTYLYPELLRTLIRFDAGEGNRLFVLIGRRTFSATSNFIADLDRLSDAVFVGEASGGKPLTLGGDGSDVVLPFSGMRAGLSNVTWQLTAPRDTRLWIAPDVPVALTAADYFANRDPVLETVLEMIRGGPAPTPR